VQLIEEPIAAAIGAELPIAEPTGNMVVDIGGGTSEVAVIALGGMIVSQSLRVGGYDFDDAITNYLKRVHSVAVGQQTSEKLKLAIGSAMPLEQELEGEIRGREVASGLPKTVQLTSAELRLAYAEPLRAVIDAVKATLERTPPELAADISTRGILLAGGGALLREFDGLLHVETELPVRLAESPLTCVVLGAGQALEEFDLLEEVDGRPTRRRSPRPRRASFARQRRR
jgi:rod shape-determining protein MreB and related proteins